MNNKPVLTGCLILFFLITVQLSFGQNGVAIAASAATADNSAMLDVQSTAKGFLVPRMNTTQRLAINSVPPATGLLVYDITIGGFFYWTGSAWVELSAGALSGSGTANYHAKWTTSSALGNSIAYDNGTNMGIGTASPTSILTVVDAGNANQYSGTFSVLANNLTQGIGLGYDGISEIAKIK